MSILMGIDSGGSRTRAALADDTGRELARAEGPSIKLLRVSRQEAELRLDALLHELCGKAAMEPKSIARTCAGLSGYSVPWLRDAMTEILLARTGHAPHLCGDEEIALAAARLQGEPGAPLVLVMAGTGSNASAQHGAESAHAGGWGPALGDEGGGHWVGREAARLALRRFDEQHSREHSPLLRELLRAWQSTSVAEFVAAAHGGGANFASLAPAVASAAGDGDDDAQNVLFHAGSELARLAAIAADKAGAAAPRVAWTGSILREIPAVRESLQEWLRKMLPGALLDTAETDPLLGALALARKRA